MNLPRNLIHLLVRLLGLSNFGIRCLMLRLFPTALSAEKLEWGNSDQLNHILQKHPEGFDLVLGADIYILVILSFKKYYMISSSYA